VLVRDHQCVQQVLVHRLQQAYPPEAPKQDQQRQVDQELLLSTLPCGRPGTGDAGSPQGCISNNTVRPGFALHKGQHKQVYCEPGPQHAVLQTGVGTQAGLEEEHR